MEEKIFFAILGVIFIYIGILLILKQADVVINIHNNRGQAFDIFKNLSTPNDKMVSEKEKIHGKHICYFIGVMSILISLVAFFLELLKFKG